MSLIPNRFRRFGGLAIAASIAAAAPASADSPPRLFVTLGYELDPGLHGCPSEVEFRDSVVKQLGYDPFRDDATHHIVAEVANSESGIEGRIEWTDATGEKEGERRLAYPGRDCGEVSRGMVFAIAVQIQLLSSAAATAPAPAPLPCAPCAEPAPVIPEKPVVAEKPKPVLPARKWGGAVGIGPTAEFGVAPSLAAGLRLFASLRYNDLSLDVGPEAILPVTMRRSDGTGFSTTTLAATAVPCAHLDRWALCAIGMLGLLVAHGFGVDDPRSPSSFIGRVGLRVAFDQPVAPRWLGAVHVDGLATLTPRTVSLNELPVWTTPTLALVVGIDLAVLFR
jgi:hypothetical protein